MPRFHLGLLIYLACLLSLAGSVRAAERFFNLDAEASKAEFEVGSTLHDVHGTLYPTDGTISFDLEQGTARGEIVVDATRTETGNKKRDKKLHGKVLESEVYPRFVFHAERFEGTLPEDGEGVFRLIGTLVLQDVEHPMELEVTARVSGGQVEASTSFQVPYVEWGLADPSVFILRVDKIVDVSLEVRGTLLPAAEAATTGGP